jgi:2-iminobutanoate/2-iminopropanoate deaminase
MKKIIATKSAPDAIGPYSQAVETSASSFVFLSGQIPLDPETMTIVGANAKEQCQQVMKNLSEVLKAAECDFSNIVKTTIYLDTMDDFQAVNEIYGAFFPENPPARATVAVSTLPKNVLVEIDAIAVK